MKLAAASACFCGVLVATVVAQPQLQEVIDMPLYCRLLSAGFELFEFQPVISDVRVNLPMKVPVFGEIDFAATRLDIRNVSVQGCTASVDTDGRFNIGVGRLDVQLHRLQWDYLQTAWPHSADDGEATANTSMSFNMSVDLVNYVPDVFSMTLGRLDLHLGAHHHTWLSAAVDKLAWFVRPIMSKLVEVAAKKALGTSLKTIHDEGGCAFVERHLQQLSLFGFSFATEEPVTTKVPVLGDVNITLNSTSVSLPNSTRCQRASFNGTILSAHLEDLTFSAGFNWSYLKLGSKFWHNEGAASTEVVAGAMLYIDVMRPKATKIKLDLPTLKLRLQPDADDWMYKALTTVMVPTVRRSLQAFGGWKLERDIAKCLADPKCPRVRELPVSDSIVALGMDEDDAFQQGHLQLQPQQEHPLQEVTELPIYCRLLGAGLRAVEFQPVIGDFSVSAPLQVPPLGEVDFAATHLQIGNASVGSCSASVDSDGIFNLGVQGLDVQMRHLEWKYLQKGWPHDADEGDAAANTSLSFNMTVDLMREVQDVFQMSLSKIQLNLGAKRHTWVAGALQRLISFTRPVVSKVVEVASRKALGSSLDIIRKEGGCAFLQGALQKLSLVDFSFTSEQPLTTRVPILGDVNISVNSTFITPPTSMTCKHVAFNGSTILAHVENASFNAGFNWGYQKVGSSVWHNEGNASTEVVAATMVYIDLLKPSATKIKLDLPTLQINLQPNADAWMYKALTTVMVPLVRRSLQAFGGKVLEDSIAKCLADPTCPKLDSVQDEVNTPIAILPDSDQVITV